MEETVSNSKGQTYTVSASLSSKYEGIIEVSFFTKMQTAFLDFFSYIDKNGPKMGIVYSIITFIRFMQIVGPSYMISNSNVWDHNTIGAKVIGLLSIIYHIVPQWARDGNESLILYILTSIQIVFYIILFATALYYKSTVRVPQVCNYLITIFMACFVFTLPVVTVQFIGELISELIVGKAEANSLNIVAVVLSFLIVGIYTWVIIDCYNTTLTFRSCSFISVEGSPQNTLFVCTMIYTFLLSVQKDFDKIWQMVLSFCAMIPCIIVIIKLFNSATFIIEAHQTYIVAGCLVSCVDILLGIYPILTDKKWDEVQVLLFLVLIIIFCFVSLFFIRRRRMKNLMILDSFDDTKDIETIGSPKVFRTVLASGFMYCHPVCLDYSVFVAATTEWPKQLGIWSTYAKFAAIYPEKSSTLAYISQSVVKNNLKGRVANAVLSQINDILKTREANLTPYLRARIAKLSKTSTKTKNKLRNIWDLVLQGNINEIDSAIHAAQKSTVENEFEVEHMISLFPNNRFAARVYSRFFLEIKADLANHKIWKENVLSLQRGVAISADSIQLLALDVFPLLPTKVAEAQNVSYGSVQGDELTDDFTSEDREDSNIALASLIKNHKFKSTKFLYVTTIALLLFLIILPAVVLIVLFKEYQREIEYPLDIMYGIAYTRNVVNMITSFTINIFATSIKENETTDEVLMTPLNFDADFPMDAYGNNRDSLNISKYLIQEIAEVNQMLNGMRSYKIGNKYMDEARKLMFEANTNFSVYQEDGSLVDHLASAEQIVTKVATQASIVTTMDEFTKEGMFSPAARTSCNNNDRSGKSMSQALTLIIDYIMDNDKYYQSLYTYIAVGIGIVIGIAIIALYITQVYLLSAQKKEIYKTMTTLPKTVISSVSSSFYSVKKAKDTSSQLIDNSCQSEVNKQEENAIKIFNSISDSSAQSSSIIAGFIFFFIAALGIFANYFIADTYKKVSTTLIESCPHIDYMLGTIAYLFSTASKLTYISLDRNVPGLEGLVELDYEIKEINSGIKKEVYYFNQLRFGGSDIREFPFVGMEKGLHDADIIMACDDPYAPPTTFLEGAICYDAEGIVYLTTAFLKKYITSIEAGYPMRPKGDDLSNVWQIGIVMQYESFFYPSSAKIVSTISDDISMKFPVMLEVSLSCIGIATFLTFIILFFVKVEDDYMRFTLSLFLHCPAKVIYGSQKIMGLLNGETKHTHDDSTQRDSDFFNSIIQKLNDIVIIFNSEDGKVIEVNTAFEKGFHVDRDEILGTDVKEFLSNPNFTTINIDEVLSKPSDVIFNNGDDFMYISTNTLNVNNTRVIIGRNNTTRVMHQRLIDEEKKKSDTMLASILPPSLVPRVQAGEKNISFAVQSASVLFLDIVEFTPWCGSNQATYVMKMLNSIFKEMDACVATHKTLSRIKCIGDCYMAAGGIFDEVNQPAVHSKEMVEFGIEAIKKIIEIDEINDEKLRIRVGINTGGPIIAGVLGTDKPTFEILGPTINIAQQMEHHGVPMMVHISRTVYELIYGGAFSIKERGEIEVKNGTMFTYLVDPQISKNTQ